MPPNRRQRYRSIIPMDGNNLSQNLIATDRRIVTGKRIAAGDQVVATFADHPVCNQSTVTMEQDNPACPEFRDLSAMNGQDVPRPYGGQHTGSIDLQAHFSILGYDFRSQFALGRFVNRSGQIHRVPSHHQETTLLRVSP